VRPTPRHPRDRAGRRRKRLLSWTCALATAALGERASAQLAAFTGAEGFGASATGGRGGSIYVVTNLNNSGAGSFRDAVSQSNRIIVFAVSGYEDITSPISAASNLTILGQTAPGGGFGVYGAEVSFYGQSNDIVQYMRFRDTSQDPNNNTSSGNCVNLGNTNNMIFDHDSLEFASYNNIDAAGTTGANNLTFQNSIIANPILSQQFNFHWEGNQGTFINNIFANAANRSILAKGNTQFVNNTVYNYLAGFTSGNSTGNFNYDIVNNYFRSGPSTTSTADDYFQVDASQTAYASGNLRNGSTDNGTGATVSNTPLLAGTTSLPTLTATAAYAFNLAHSGDSLTHDPTTFASSLGYDQVDQQVINDVASNGTQGRIYNNEDDTGLGSTNDYLGTITPGTAPTSTANDGIPDSWKKTHGLSTSVADSTLLNPLGYYMIEQYAQEISDEYSTQTWTAASGEWNNNSSNWSTLPGPYDHALISGNGTADGVATLSTTGAMAYSLQIGANGLPAGEKLLVSGGSLTVYNGITVGYQNNGSLQITGGTVTAATVQLGNTVWNSNGTSSTTYTGTLVLSGGTLQAGEVMQGGGTPDNWTTGSAWTWSGGTLQAGPAGLLVGAPATLGAGGGILDTNSVSAQVNGALSGAGGFTVIGGGTATLAASNTYLGSTTITASTLVAPLLANGGSPSSLGASSNAAANLILNGGTLMGTGSTDRLFTLAGSSTLDNSNGMSFTNTGAIALAGGANVTLTLTGSNGGHNTFSPALGDPGGGFVTSVVVSGTGLWDFSNGAKSYSGDTDVISGELQTLTTNSLSPQSNMVISSGATLDFHANSQTINALSGAGSVTDSFGSGQTFTIGQSNGSGNFSGTINGDLSLVKSGSGVQVFSGANTYSNGTIITGGTLQIGNGTAGSISNSSASTVSAPGTLAFDMATGASYTGNISNGGTVAGVETSGITNTLGGVISGSGVLNQSGSGTLTLTNPSSSFTGNITVSSGTLTNTGAVNSANPTTGGLGNPQTPGRTITVNSGGTLSLNIGNSFGNAASTPQLTTIINQGGVVVTNAPNENGGGGGDANTFGNIILNGGTLTAGNGYSTLYQAIVLSGTVTVGGSAASTINTNATNTTSNGVMLGSNTIFNVANVTGNSNPSLTVSDNLTWVQGATTGGGFTKAGAGVMLLTGVNNYTGTTTVSAGTLTIGGAGQLGAGSYAGSISNSGTFVFNSTAGQTLSGIISGAGAVTDSGSGTLTLSGNETFAGTLTAGSGSTLFLTGNNTARGTSVTQLNGNGTLQLQANAGNIVNGSSSALTGSATGFTVLSSYPTAQSVAIQLRSDSSVTFTGANGLGGVGNTAMNFDVGNITAGNSNNTLTFAPGGFNVFETTINVTGESGYSLGLGTLTNVGAGNLTLNPTTGNLIVAGIGESANYTAPLIVQGSGNTTITGAIATGSSSLTMVGTGTLTLSGTESFTGTTTVSAGTLTIGGAGQLGAGSYAGNISNSGTFVVLPGEA
jgi:fibronectin-binding autotransporter adhesin